MLETALAEMNHLTLIPEDPIEWVVDVDPKLGLDSDPCTNFHPGIEKINQFSAPTICDCNENQVADVCHIDSGTSPDKNSDGRPDECAGQVRRSVRLSSNLAPGGPSRRRPGLPRESAGS